MDDAHNPYLPPSLAAVAEKQPQRWPAEKALARFRYLNAVVSFGLMVPGFYCSVVNVLSLIAIVVYLGFSRHQWEFYTGCLLLPLLLLIGVLGIYQRKLNFVAVTVNSLLAAVTLVGLLALGSYIILEVSRQGFVDLNTLWVLLLVTCGCFLAAIPIYVATQAWTWHRQGIDLSEIRAEIRRRA